MQLCLLVQISTLILLSNDDTWYGTPIDGLLLYLSLGQLDKTVVKKMGFPSGAGI